MQHGVASRAQLVDCGITRRMIDQLVTQGLLVAVIPGRVYAPGGHQLSRWAYPVAASLACGEGAVLSHGTAAAIHGISPQQPGAPPEMSVPPGRHPRVPGAVLHRARVLDERDVEERKGIKVTAAPRTLIDIAGRLEPPQLARVVDEGMIARLWTVDQIASALERAGAQGRSGSAALRRLLAERAGEPGVDSQLELRMVRLLRDLRPFETRYQLVLDGSVVILDIAWPAVKVAAEVDGFDVRSRSRTKFDHDRRRGNLLLAHGWCVVHLTSRMSDEEVPAAVAMVLQQRGWR